MKLLPSISFCIGQRFTLAILATGVNLVKYFMTGEQDGSYIWEPSVSVTWYITFCFRTATVVPRFPEN